MFYRTISSTLGEGNCSQNSQHLNKLSGHRINGLIKSVVTSGLYYKLRAIGLQN